MDGGKKLCKVVDSLFGRKSAVIILAEKLRSILVILAVMQLGAMASLFGQSNSATPLVGPSIRVACVGASTTYGATLENISRDSYPAQLQVLLGPGWVVQNFGVNGAGVLERGDIPYRKTDTYREALKFLPDIVILNIGVNDSKPSIWQYKEDFVRDFQRLINDFRGLPSHPKVYICREIPVFQQRWGIRAKVVLKELYPLKKKIARRDGLPMLDLYTPLLGKPALFTDGIHPNKEGTAIMAKTVASVLKGTNYPNLRIKR